MIIYGSRATNIGNFEALYEKCGYWQQTSTQRISVFGKYAHIFWIPLFPIGKQAIAECAHCKRTIAENEFSPSLHQFYEENKYQSKRPLWHWLGLLLIGGFIALTTIFGITAEKDPRKELLDSDLSLMDSAPTMVSDSISYKIKKMFDLVVLEDMKPETFEYYTKIQGDKALILVKMPKLKSVEKENRNEALKIIEVIADNQKDLEGKELYIGVQGEFSMMLVKTPTYEKNSKLALSSKLYDFYGPKGNSKK